MADLGDFYNAGASQSSPRPSQAPQTITGNVAVSGGVGADNLTVIGVVALLGLCFLLLHLE